MESLCVEFQLRVRAVVGPAHTAHKRTGHARVVVVKLFDLAGIPAGFPAIICRRPGVVPGAVSPAAVDWRIAKVEPDEDGLAAAQELAEEKRHVAHGGADGQLADVRKDAREDDL